MKKLALGIAAVLITGVGVAHWYYSDRGRFTSEPVYTGLDREVTGNDLISHRDPAVTLRFDPAFDYVGGQKFVLYGVADTEQHFFVETTPDGKLRSAYWVQYEAYLPDNRYTYDYDSSPARLTLQGHEFFVDTEAVESDPNRKGRRGSDGALARQFLASKGYTFPREFAYARLVHLPGASRRKELMIIFVDDLAPSGLSAASLLDGGANASQWPEVEQAHLDRIRETLELVPVGTARQHSDATPATVES